MAIVDLGNVNCTLMASALDKLFDKYDSAESPEAKEQVFQQVVAEQFQAAFSKTMNKLGVQYAVAITPEEKQAIYRMAVQAGEKLREVI